MRLLAVAALLSSVALAQDPEELYRRAVRLLSENQPQAAAEALNQCVRLKPDHAAAWKALGVVFASQDHYDDAEKPFRTACELRPDLPDACLYYGRTLYLLNRFQPALEVLRRVLVRQPENVETLRLTALSLEALGDNAGAGATFRKALTASATLVPENDPAIDYGVFLYRQGRAEEAVAPLEDVLKRHPNTARAHLELGCVLLALDRLPLAEQHLERAVALSPNSARSHLLLGKVYLRLGKTAAGEEQLRQGSLTAR